VNRFSRTPSSAPDPHPNAELLEELPLHGLGGPFAELDRASQRPLESGAPGVGSLGDEDRSVRRTADDRDGHHPDDVRHGIA